MKRKWKYIEEKKTNPMALIDTAAQEYRGFVDSDACNSSFLNKIYGRFHPSFCVASIGVIGRNACKLKLRHIHSTNLSSELCS